MSAILKLTDKERAQVRKDLIAEKRNDYLFMLEVLGESAAWHHSYIADNPLGMSEMMDFMLIQYLDKYDYFGEAERDLLAAIERSGGRKWFYGN